MMIFSTLGYIFQFVDVQFILTDEELMTYQSRIRRARAELLAQSRTKSSMQLNAYKLRDPPSMRSTAPYVDPQSKYITRTNELFLSLTICTIWDASLYVRRFTENVSLLICLISCRKCC